MRIGASVFHMVGYVGLALYASCHAPLTPVSSGATDGLAAMNIVIMLLVLMGMLAYYSYAVRKARIEMRAQNSKLEDALQQLREAQSQIIAQQKLASSEPSLPGIAEEISHPLTFVKNFVALSLDTIAELTQNATRACRRGRQKTPKRLRTPWPCCR